MKTFLYAILLTGLLSATAQASPSVTCSNGDISEVGDGLFQVEIFEDNVRHVELSQRDPN